MVICTVLIFTLQDIESSVQQLANFLEQPLSQEMLKDVCTHFDEEVVYNRKGETELVTSASKTTKTSTSLSTIVTLVLKCRCRGDLASEQNK